MRSALLILLFMTPTAASAQDPLFGPQRSAWGPRLDTIGVFAANRIIWRGLDLGAGASMGTSIGIHGRPVTSAGRWGISAVAAAHHVDARYGVARTRGMAAAELLRMVGSNDASMRIHAGFHAVSDAPNGAAGTELGARVDGVAIPWLPEVWPTLHAGVIRNGGPLEGTWLDVALRQTVGIQQFAVHFEGGVDWNDAGRSRFTAPMLRGEAGLSFGVSQLMLRVSGGAAGASGRAVGWAGAGAAWYH